MTSIEWTDETWNPVRGCSIVSAGCDNCYAMRMAWRLSGPGGPYEGLVRKTRSRRAVWTGETRPVEHLMRKPFTWAEPRMVFVNSMSDFFHEKVSYSDIVYLLHVMADTPRHTYQILTKRPETAEKTLERIRPMKLSDNIWLGVSVENEHYMHRVDVLRGLDARIRFLSCEPLLGPLPDLDLDGVHWVIVGAESGPGARPMELQWARDIHKRCMSAGVPFFMKQICDGRGRRIPYARWTPEWRTREFPVGHRTYSATPETART